VEAAIGEDYIRVEWGTTFASLHESHFPQRLLARGRVNSGRLALNLILQCGGAAYLPQDIVMPLIAEQRLFEVPGAPPIEMKAYAAFGLHGEHHKLVAELLKRLS
jgi:DNA-binding transcriptional LysR family regulator